MEELKKLIDAVSLAVKDIGKYETCPCHADKEADYKHLQSLVSYVSMCLTPAYHDYQDATNETGRKWSLRLRLLADWFDVEQRQRTQWTSNEVQRDLRALAAKIENILL
jgi:hypothetical protein